MDLITEPQHTRSKNRKLKDEIDSRIIPGHFNAPLSIIDRMTIQKINQVTEDETVLPEK